MSFAGYKRLDGIASVVSASAVSPYVGGASSVAAITTYAKNTGRVPQFVLGDSNGYKDEFGIVGALQHAFGSRGMLFGSGIIGAKHQRASSTRTNALFWPFNNNNDDANFARNYRSFSGATWTHGTLTLTGTFTNYTGKAGDRVTITGGTNATQADYVVVSGNATTIVLSTTIGASATTGISGYITPAAGTTSLSTIPQAFHDSWNMPMDWLPLTSAMNYHGSGSHFFAGQDFLWHKFSGALPCQGALVYSVGHLGFNTGATAAKASIGQSDGSAGYTNIIDAAIDSNGTDGLLKWSRVTAPAGDRLTGLSSREYFRCTVNGFATNGAYCYLFGHACLSAIAKGVSTQGFLCKGGESAYDIARTLNFLSNGTVDNFLKALVDQCSSAVGGDNTRRAHAWIFTGFNDHDETTTSLGPNPTTSYTAAGYIDNITAIITRLRARWDSLYGAGTGESELHFTIVPSHPISDSPTTPITPPVGTNLAARQARTVTYVEAARTFANSNPNVSSVDIASILGANPFTNLYGQYMTYSNTGSPTTDDILHLSPGGYVYLMGKILSAIGY